MDTSEIPSSQIILATTINLKALDNQDGIKTRNDTSKTPFQWLQTRNLTLATSRLTINGNHSLRPSNNSLAYLRRSPPRFNTNTTHPNRHTTSHTLNIITKCNATSLAPTIKPFHNPRPGNPINLPLPPTVILPPLPQHAPPPPPPPRPPAQSSNLRRRRHPPRKRQHAPPHRSARFEPQNPAPKRHRTRTAGRQKESHVTRRGRSLRS